MSGIDEILVGYDGLQAGQEAFYKDLREHPELSHQERLRRALRGRLGRNPPADRQQDPRRRGRPYTYWGIGFTDRQTYLAAEKNGHLEDLPTNHSPKFLPPLQPTLRTGTEAPVTAALVWLAA
jgi:hypothetical protein